MRQKLSIVYLFVFFFCLILTGPTSICRGEVQKWGTLEKIPPVPVRADWNRFKILVWPYKTNVLIDYKSYRELGIGGFQIDRGAGKDKMVAFSLANHFPYYVGHIADKGFLYLSGDNAKAVTRQRGLSERPGSLADPKILNEIKTHIKKNVNTTKKGLVLAYALDDEISIGSLTNPCDVDVSPPSLDWFRVWLEKTYGDIPSLNREWGTNYKNFGSVYPKGFEDVREQLDSAPLSQWKLAPWIDFRSFMDYQFAAVLSELTRYTNQIDPGIPAGFVGGQAPGPWGGYNYALLSRSVQWMEAYDIHGTNEILRSWWNDERRPRMRTFFSSRNFKIDTWQLWYYLLHGNQAVIAWPEGWFNTEGQTIAPHISALEDTFKEIQGNISEVIADPATRFDPDPIGIYYSHPSIQVGWAMDAVTHGKTWINRLSSIDNENQSIGILRKVWCKTLEDLGYQYDFVNYLDLIEGTATLSSRFKVIILPKTLCLSETEAAKLRKFVAEGGLLVADYMCGIFNEHGTGRDKGVLDTLFGIERNESSGFMNGKGLTEIDGEKYKAPFSERFTCYRGAKRHMGLPVIERGTRSLSGTRVGKTFSTSYEKNHPYVLIENNINEGRTIYLNLSPLEFWDCENRFGNFGDEWRAIVIKILAEAGLRPRVKIFESGTTVNMMETLFWKNKGKRYLGLIKNPTNSIELSKQGKQHLIEGVTGNTVELSIEFSDEILLIDLKKNISHGKGRKFNVQFDPWKGSVYEIRSSIK